MTTFMKSVNVLIGVTGSVAAIKIPLFLSGLRDCARNKGIDIHVKLVHTNASRTFVNYVELITLPNTLIHSDEEEWSMWNAVGDPVLHIELRKWAHIGVILPLDANTLAKISNGICDNLLTCVMRAWDFNTPIIVFPCMNTFMWEHPLTSKQLKDICELGYTVIDPVSKKLACGDIGVGALPPVEDCINHVMEAICKLEISNIFPV